MVKSKITRLVRYKVWKVSNVNRPYPMYVFGFKAACRVADLMSKEKECAGTKFL